MTKREKRNVGTFVAVPLPDIGFGIARILPNPLVGAYGIFNEHLEGFDLDHVSNSSFIFRVWVANWVFSSGRWPTIGHRELSENELVPPKFFREDRIRKKYYLYDHETSDKNELAVADCEGLERAAVWEPLHFEERLVAHYHGRLSSISEHLRAK